MRDFATKIVIHNGHFDRTYVRAVKASSLPLAVSRAAKIGLNAYKEHLKLIGAKRGRICRITVSAETMPPTKREEEGE